MTELEKLKDITAIQCEMGNWNFDPYMHGMANGMILAVATMENGVPKYINPPKTWLSKDEKENEALRKDAKRLEEDLEACEAERDELKARVQELEGMMRDEGYKI